MSEYTPPTLFNRIWYLISRLSILGGMMLVFASFGYLLSLGLIRILYGIDLMENPSWLTNLDGNPAALSAAKLVQVIVSCAMLMVPAWWFGNAIEQPRSAFLQLEMNRKPLVWLSVVLVVLISTPLISYLIQWNEQLTLPPQYAELEMMLRSSEALAAKLTKAFLSGEGLSSLIEKTIIIALLPAITEEFFFRGALQQFLRLQLKNIHAAIWITAIIFSAFHGQFFGFFPRLFLGALLGYVCVYTSSIWPAILMHFVNNFIAVLLVHYHLDEGQSIIFAEDYQFPIAVVIASMILTVAIIYFMFKQNDKKLE